MDLRTILPHLAGVRITRIEPLPDELILDVVTRATGARCPVCHRRSRRRHGHYTRTVADHPIGGRRLTVHLQVRRFRCRTPACQRRTFAAPVPTLVARYARRSVPLQQLVQEFGLHQGGRPGARAAARQGIAVSRSTLLRLVRCLPEPVITTPRLLGVDDFAFRRGHRYGTLLIDLATHQPVDVLPDRRAASLAAWLRAHGQPEVICRDRAGAYADGARQGAPTAVQVADRWHLLQNATGALTRVLARHRAALRAAAAAAGTDPSAPPPPDPPVAVGAAPAAHPEPVVPPSGPPPPAPLPDATAVAPIPDPPATADAGRQARYDAIIALHTQGWSISAISRHLALTRLTVRTYLRAGTCPERAPHPTTLGPLSPHAAYLRERWTAGCCEAATLWRELQARGFRGSARTVRRHVQAWRPPPEPAALPSGPPRGGPTAPPSTPPSGDQLSPRQAAWLLLRPSADLTPREQAARARLEEHPVIQAAQAVVGAFRRVVREQDEAALAPWLAQAQASGSVELREFGAGIGRDQAAVAAALRLPYSSGPVEGQVTRVKLVKRAGYGRATFEVLRKRILLAR
jgi:transposase